MLFGLLGGMPPESLLPHLRKPMTMPEPGRDAGAAQSLTAVRAAFDSDAARWFMARLYAEPRFAHHPDCRCYDAHVLRFAGIPLCLGCTSAGCGAVLAAAALWAAWSHAPQTIRSLGAAGVVAAGCVLFLPTLAQPFVQRKPYKIAARCMLGAAVVLLWFGAMVLLPATTTGMLLRGVFLGIFMATFRATLRFRAAFAQDPTRDCPGATYPLCRDHIDRLRPLLGRLERMARPEDAPFVAFANALVAGDGQGVSVEVLSLGRAAPRGADGLGPAARGHAACATGCFHGDRSPDACGRRPG